ncbi:hypothetical protein ABPG77_009762 [Micractinium sp. CCAP 211/92]
MAAGADSHEHPASGPLGSHPLLLSQLAIPPEPGFQYLGSRVEHVLAPRDGLLSELVTEALDLPQGAAAALLRFGAIHTCPVPPAIPAANLAAMPPEQAARMQAERREAQRRAGNSSQARTPQRMTEDAVVPRHSYVRVHLHPKRFPVAHSVAWQDRIVADTPEFVVVSKPAGVPAAPTVDNLLECAPCCAAQASRACRVRGPALLCPSTVQQPRLCALLCQDGLQSLPRRMAGCPALGGPTLPASLNLPPLPCTGDWPPAVPAGDAPARPVHRGAAGAWQDAGLCGSFQRARQAGRRQGQQQKKRHEYKHKQQQQQEQQQKQERQQRKTTGWRQLRGRRRRARRFRQRQRDCRCERKCDRQQRWAAPPPPAEVLPRRHVGAAPAGPAAALSLCGAAYCRPAHLHHCARARGGGQPCR